MILYQIHPPRVALPPFEGDAPGSVHMNGVTFRFSAQNMKIEARNIQIFQSFRFVERRQSNSASFDQFRWHTAWIVVQEQQIQPLMSEAFDHESRPMCNMTCDIFAIRKLVTRGIINRGAVPNSRQFPCPQFPNRGAVPNSNPDPPLQGEGRGGDGSSVLPAWWVMS